MACTYRNQLKHNAQPDRSDTKADSLHRDQWGYGSSYGSSCQCRSSWVLSSSGKQNYREMLRQDRSPGERRMQHSAWSGPFSLLPRQLLIEFRNVVIPFCLVASASHRHPQLILAAESCYLELPSLVAGAIGQDGLIAGQLLRLLVHQPHVAVQPCRDETALQVHLAWSYGVEGLK